jgi:hypothetical protein
MKQGLLFTDKTEDVQEESAPLLRSFSFSQDEILSSIIKLYIPAGKIQVDPCYCKGGFYRSGVIPHPDYVCDIEPRKEGITKGDCRNLPFSDNSINSIIFDPPWITYPGKNYTKKLRKYGSFRTYKDLKKMYSASFKEFSRVLKKDGILIVKCQDGSYGPYFTNMHVDDVILPCRECGFRDIDNFILLSRQRIENRNGKQRMSRKYHCYFLVFRKG